MSAGEVMKKCIRDGNVELALKAAGKTGLSSLYQSTKAKIRLLEAMQQE